MTPIAATPTRGELNTALIAARASGQAYVYRAAHSWSCGRCRSEIRIGDVYVRTGRAGTTRGVRYCGVRYCGRCALVIWPTA